MTNTLFLDAFFQVTKIDTKGRRGFSLPQGLSHISNIFYFEIIIFAEEFSFSRNLFSSSDLVLAVLTSVPAPPRTHMDAIQSLGSAGAIRS